MAEKQYLLGNRARELLIYTNQATKISSGDVSSTGVKKLIHQIARAEDLQQVKAICDGLEKALGKNASHGFSKSAYRCYGEDMRMIAKGIVRDIRSANSKRFEVEYEERLRLIQSVLDGCGLLLDYIQICLELNIVSTQKAAVWTKKVQDVNYMTLAWRKTDAARADGQRGAAQKAAALHREEGSKNPRLDAAKAARSTALELKGGHLCQLHSALRPWEPSSNLMSIALRPTS